MTGSNSVDNFSPPSFKLPHAQAAPLQEVVKQDKEKLAQTVASHRMTKDEYQKLLACLGRDPTWCELGVVSSMWSEHCSYKSSRVHLKRFPTKGPHVVVGPGENAGVVRLWQDICLAFKMESHNHPTFIEPYQGAATGVGGILRDVFCMGARPFANLNCLRFGERSEERTPWLLARAVKGIGDYGNCIGIPTVAGSLSFDATYNGNCLVNAMTVGVVKEKSIFKGFASGVGNWVVYLGSATGRDGVHGATMSSGSFDEGAEHSKTTIQVGDPFAEKLLLEATLEILEKNLVVGLQDMGAAGLSSSSFEMAGRAGNGLILDLGRVPLRASNMSAYEMMLSESQERMLIVIEPKNWPAVAEIFAKWQLSYAVIGEVTNTGRLQAYLHGKLEVDLPVAELTDLAPQYQRPLAEPGPRPVTMKKNALSTAKGLEILPALLREDGWKEPLFKQYDRHIGVQTVRTSDHGGAGALWVKEIAAAGGPEHMGVAVTAACNELYVAADPYWGAAHAVAKCQRTIAALGGEALGLTDCLNFGNPEDPHVMWSFSRSVDGISHACEALSVPVVSGNVSLYNETSGKSIHPTPMIGMVGKITDVRQAPAAVLQGDEADRLFLFGPTQPVVFHEGTLVQKVTQGKMTAFAGLHALDLAGEKELALVLRQWIEEGLVAACRDVGKGGILTTLSKMWLGGLANNASCRVELGSWQPFEEYQGLYLVQLRAAAHPPRLPAALSSKACFTEIASWKASQTPATLDCGGVSFPAASLLKEFHSGLAL